MHSNTEHFPATRETLLNRLRNWSDDKSWREFFDNYWRLIYGVARKSGLTEQEAQDAVQETVVTVAKTISEYQYDPAVTFKGWLRHLTRKRILDQFRRRGRAQRFKPFDGEDASQFLESIPDPAGSVLDSIWEDEWQNNLVETALEELKLRVKKVSHYQAFYLHVIKKQEAGRVGKALGMSTGQVYLVRHRLSKLFKKAIARVEKAEK